MKSAIVGWLAETPVHPGTGQNVGAVDLPVAREAATDYPVIVGSSMKGALRDKARYMEGSAGKTESPAIKHIYGSKDAAARVSVSDARLLLLPVRSLTTHFRWVTCPYILERLQRDFGRLGIATNIPKLELNQGEAFVLTPEEGEQTLFLEELNFDTRTNDSLKSVAEAITPLIYHSSVQERLAKQLTIISDKDFSYFAKHGLAINARNELDDGKKSINLWYEESLPADTLFYSLLISVEEKDLQQVRELFAKQPYLQVGGNETTGQGWLAAAWIEGRD